MLHLISSQSSKI